MTKPIAWLVVELAMLLATAAMIIDLIDTAAAPGRKAVQAFIAIAALAVATYADVQRRGMKRNGA